MSPFRADGPQLPRRCQQGKRSKGKVVAPSLVALGTDTGVVVVWDLKRAEVKHRLGDGTDAGGAAVPFCPLPGAPGRCVFKPRVG